MSKLRDSLKRLPLLNVSRSKQIFKQTCERFDLVYFGSVSQYNDEHEMVRGFTLSPSHIDQNYCVGTISGRDVILLQRTDTISFPDKPSVSFTWTILQVDLHKETMPHIILDATRYDEMVYAHLFTKFPHLRPYDPSVFSQHESVFTSQFQVYGSLQHLDDIKRVLPMGTTSVLGHHFTQFDYEVFQDSLIIYLPNNSPSMAEIEHMVKAGLWLAGEFDNS